MLNWLLYSVRVLFWKYTLLKLFFTLHHNRLCFTHSVWNPITSLTCLLEKNFSFHKYKWNINRLVGQFDLWAGILNETSRISKPSNCFMQPWGTKCQWQSCWSFSMDKEYRQQQFNTRQSIIVRHADKTNRCISCCFATKKYYNRWVEFLLILLLKIIFNFVCRLVNII